MNLLAVEQATSTRAATHTVDEPESLIEANRVHADASQLRRLTDANRSRHASKDKPWSYVQSQEGFFALFPKKSTQGLRDKFRISSLIRDPSA